MELPRKVPCRVQGRSTFRVGYSAFHDVFHDLLLGNVVQSCHGQAVVTIEIHRDAVKCTRHGIQ